MTALTHQQLVDAMTETLTEIGALFSAGRLSPLSGVIMVAPDRTKQSEVLVQAAA